MNQAPEDTTEPLPATAGLLPCDLDEERNPALVYLRRMDTKKSRETVEAVLRSLARIASGGRIRFEVFPWEELTYLQTAALRTAIGERFEPAGANLRLSVLRCVLKEAWRLELMTAEAYQRAADVQNFRGKSKPAGRRLEQEELRGMIQGARSSGGPKGTRDAALFGFLYATGARRREAVGVRWPADVDLERGGVELRTKGKRHRTADLQRPVIQALEDWLRVRGPAPGALFCPVDRFGQVKTDRELTPGAVLQICRQWAHELGLRHFSPHDFRRTFAAELLDAGVDLHVCQEMLDHAEIATTARYDPGRSNRRRAEMNSFAVEIGMGIGRPGECVATSIVVSTTAMNLDCISMPPRPCGLC